MAWRREGSLGRARGVEGHPATAGVEAVPWLARQLRVGLGLGLGLGLCGQTLLWLGDGKVEPMHGAVAALVTAMVFSLVALAIGLLTLPVARVCRWGPALAAGLLSAFTFFHLVSLWVRWLTGTFPSVAPFGMLLASPAQFLRAGLVGQAWRVVALILVSAGLAVVVRGRLASVPTARTSGHRLLILCLGMASTIAFIVAAPPASHAIRVLQNATPELRWMTTAVVVERSFEAAAADLPASPGEPLLAGQRWAEEVSRLGGPRPNILLLMLESASAAHFHHAGYPRPVSPSIDRLAAGGWRSARAWATATQSNYAQTSILSSLLPLRRRQLEMYYRLDYPRVLFHDVFARLGYDTATISSQNEEWQGMRRFHETGTPTYFFHSLQHPGPHLGRGAERKIPDHLTAHYALAWLARDRDRPWALYVNFQRTHFPYELPPELPGPYQPSEPTPRTFLKYPPEEQDIVVNRYDNALAYVDAQVGRLVEHLERTGQLDSTLIAVVADHGELFGEFGMVTHGKSLSEPEVRVPLILHWPERLAPRVLDTPVSSLDLLPTLLGLLEVPPHPAFQGRSFADAAAYEAARPAQYLTLQSLRSNYGVVCWPWKLIVDWSTSDIWMFNLEHDPGETLERFDPANPLAAALLDLLASQRRAQLDYYLGDPERRRREYAPRLLSCPDFGTQPAASSPSR
jgi:arylsulfatase A-like enzyme